MISDAGWVKNLSLIFFGQLVIIGLFSLLFYYTKDKTTSISVVSGGLIYCVPALIAGLFMSRSSDKSAELVVAKAFLGTLYKIVITVFLFIYVFKHVEIDIVFFLSAYTMTFIAQYVISYVLYKSN